MVDPETHTDQEKHRLRAARGLLAAVRAGIAPDIPAEDITEALRITGDLGKPETHGSLFVQGSLNPNDGNH
jgi:hypothetical protein